MTLPNDSPYTKPAYVNTSTSIDSKYALPSGYRPLSFVMLNPELDFFFMQDLPNACPNANAEYKKNSNDLIKKYQSRSKEVSDELKADGFDPKQLFNKTDFEFNDIALLYDEFRSYKSYYGMNYKFVTDELYDSV